jgi:hypothetical protein
VEPITSNEALLWNVINLTVTNSVYDCTSSEPNGPLSSQEITRFLRIPKITYRGHGNLTIGLHLETDEYSPHPRLTNLKQVST